jgi:hypothetical protein
LFPHEAQDLEALLPETFCNEPLTRASHAGAGGSLDPTIAAALKASGKTDQEVSTAFGSVDNPTETTCEDEFFAVRVAGS